MDRRHTIGEYQNYIGHISFTITNIKTDETADVTSFVPGKS